MNKTATNPLARAVETYRSVVPNPLVQALLLGGLAYGAGRLAWNPITETIRSIARKPGKAQTGMSDQEWDSGIDELKEDSSIRRWAPAALGALAQAGSLAFTHQPNKQYNGQFSWNAPLAPYQQANPRADTYTSQAPGQEKTGALAKKADEMFEYGGYMPEIDYSQVINARQATSLFTNDPYLQNEPYVRNMGTAIVSNAALQAGTGNPTQGNVFDSAVQKINNKLSFSGLASMGVKTAVSNGFARLFTGALGAMTDLSPTTQRNLIDTGTWAGAITSILE